ncbi:hypothetical protein MG293_013408, partial [Ovis ammon polii]
WPCDYIHTNEKSSVGEGGPSEHQGIKVKEIFTSWPLASYERISPKETREGIWSLSSASAQGSRLLPASALLLSISRYIPTSIDPTRVTTQSQNMGDYGSEIQNIKPQEVSGFYHGVLVNPQQLAASSSGPPGRSSRSRAMRMTLSFPPLPQTVRHLWAFLTVYPSKADIQGLGFQGPVSSLVFGVRLTRAPALQYNLIRKAMVKEATQCVAFPSFMERAVEEEYSLSRNPYLSDVSRVKELLYRVLPMAFLQYTFSEKMWEINDRHQYESSPSKSKPPFGGKLLWKGNEHLQGINNQLPPVSAHTSPPPPIRHAYSVPPDSGSSPDLPLHPHTQSQLQLSPACGPGSLNCSYYSKLSPSPSTFPFLLSLDENNEESEEHKVEKEKVKWNP